jgi:hypothetical protein
VSLLVVSGNYADLQGPTKPMLVGLVVFPLSPVDRWRQSWR